MPTRLAIKKLAGILYFCKSTVENISIYSGSGVEWKDRIKKYGKENIETLWISDWYICPHEIQRVALDFSRENQIVESDKWANLKPENGLDGGSKKGHKKSKESVTKRSGDHHPRKKNPEKWSDVGNNLKVRPDGTSMTMDRIKNGTHNFLNNQYKGNLDDTVYEWINLNNRTTQCLTRQEFMKLTGATDSAVCRVISGNRKTLKGWALNSGELPTLMIRENCKIYTFKNINTGEVVTMPINDFMRAYSLPSGGLSQLIANKKNSVKGWKLYNEPPDSAGLY